jgi:hypothetical protein
MKKKDRMRERNEKMAFSIRTALQNTYDFKARELSWRMNHHESTPAFFIAKRVMNALSG